MRGTCVVALLAALLAAQPAAAQGSDTDPFAAILPPIAPAAAGADPLLLRHPAVIDAATLSGDGRSEALFGIAALPGIASDGLQSFITAAGDQVLCQPHGGAPFICVLPDGTDLALVSLANGAAKATAEAPAAYRAQQSEAQTARRGAWAVLPPPPVLLRHPAATDTATLTANGAAYRLDGLEGIGGAPAGELAAYVAAHGDALWCAPLAGARHVCLLPDATDVAEIALLNGVARAAADAPAEYFAQQNAAILHRRGIWQTASRPASAPAAPSQLGSLGGDVPRAMIGGEAVFLVYAGPAGWGYWDRHNQFRAAPEPLAQELDRTHPAGAGLRDTAGEAPR